MVAEVDGLPVVEGEAEGEPESVCVTERVGNMLAEPVTEGDMLCVAVTVKEPEVVQEPEIVPEAEALVVADGDIEAEPDGEGEVEGEGEKVAEVDSDGNGLAEADCDQVPVFV